MAVAFVFAPRRSPGPAGAEPEEGGPNFQGKSMDSCGAKRTDGGLRRMQASGCVVEHSVSDRSFSKFAAYVADFIQSTVTVSYTQKPFR